MTPARTFACREGFRDDCRPTSEPVGPRRDSLSVQCPESDPVRVGRGTLSSDAKSDAVDGVVD
jgi:hypothetical protein